ncbi:MAG: cell division protein FtsQ/DivIB [Pseudomonadota bacterium]
MWPLKRRSKAPKRPKVDVEMTLPKAPPKSLKLLMDLRPEAQMRGPGPSKVMYRLTRSWKKVWVRRTSLIVLPLCMIAIIVWRTATDPEVIATVAEKKAELLDMMAQRPEFAVHGLDVTGASDPLRSLVEETVALPERASSLDLDVAEIQKRIVALAAVRDAQVQLGVDGMLEIRVDEQIAEALWQDEEGSLWLVDRDGIEIAAVPERKARPDLPLVLGDAAPGRMEEALALFGAVPDLQPRLRAIVRVGKRRWNVALDRGLTILLPEREPVAALERVMAWHLGEELLDRSLVAVDMRLGERPTLRMSPAAAETYRLDRERANAEGEET